jgi:hypothetical protein
MLVGASSISAVEDRAVPGHWEAISSYCETRRGGVSLVIPDAYSFAAAIARSTSPVCSNALASFAQFSLLRAFVLEHPPRPTYDAPE